MPSTPNPSLPGFFDPETYSAVQPGTNPDAFNKVHHEPKRDKLDSNLALPRWAIVLLICVPLAVFCLAVTVYYLARNRRTNMKRITSPIELRDIESQGQRHPSPTESLPELYWPGVFPTTTNEEPSAAHSSPHLRSRSPQHARHHSTTPTLPSPPPRSPRRLMASMKTNDEDEWEDATTNANNDSFTHAFAAHHRDRRARTAVNDAFAQHRRRRLAAAHQLADGADTDVIAASDTYTMGPQSSLASDAYSGGPLPPLYTNGRRRIASDSADGFVPSRGLMHGYGGGRAVSPLEQGELAQFPSSVEEMSAFAETELTDDPFVGEVRRNRERERR